MGRGWKFLKEKVDDDSAACGRFLRCRGPWGLHSFVYSFCLSEKHSLLRTTPLNPTHPSMPHGLVLHVLCHPKSFLPQKPLLLPTFYNPCCLCHSCSISHLPACTAPDSCPARPLSPTYLKSPRRSAPCLTKHLCKCDAHYRC